MQKNEIITKTSFYYFTKNFNVPKYFTNKNEWQQIYNNFRLLRSYSSQSTNKRKSDELNDQINFISTTNDVNIISPSPPQTTINFRRRLTIKDIIGKKNFATKQAKILFNCKHDETVYKCLSKRIDLFNLILTRRKRRKRFPHRRWFPYFEIQQKYI